MKNQPINQVNFKALHTVKGNQNVVSKIVTALAEELPDVFVGQCKEGNCIHVAPGEEELFFSSIDQRVRDIVNRVIDACGNIVKPKYSIHEGYGYGNPHVGDDVVELTLPSPVDNMPMAVAMYDPKTKMLVETRGCGI